VEDYLPAGNALGYNENWQYRHTGGELLLMGATGEPSGYYPMDSNGLAVQSEPPVACVCYVAAGLDVCAPLECGECDGNLGDAEECILPLPMPAPQEEDVVLTFRGRQKPCTRWQRWWCHNIICRRHGGMLDCWRIFRCRWFSIIMCICRGRP
jgi:hypothetical protein